MSCRNPIAVASIVLLASWPSGQSREQFEVAVDDPRPLARAIDAIEQRFGWTVTYEDPPYENASEIEDVTDRVRRDGKTHPRVLGPRGGAFHFSYALNPESGSNPDELLGALLSRYEASGNPGFYRVFAEGAAFHVVPRMIVDARGVDTDVHSVLDARIRLQPGEKNLAEVVAAIAVATTAAGGKQIVSHGPNNLLLQTRVVVDGRTQSARAALLGYMGASRLPMSWRLLYDPGMRKYVLNLHIRD
jgi:hypothetical protein